MKATRLTISVNTKLWIRREDTPTGTGFAMIVRSLTPATTKAGQLAWNVECSMRYSSGKTDVFTFRFYDDGHGEDETGLRLSVVRFDRKQFIAARTSAEVTK